MTKEEKDFVLACVLGDGCINKRIVNNTIQCRYLLKHSIKQKEYFDWKVSKLIPILSNGKVNSKPSMEHNCGRSGITCVRYEKNHKYLKDLYYFIYENGKKTFSRKVLDRLTAEGVAIWYMDDGSLYNVKYTTIKEKLVKYRTAQLTLSTYISIEENNVIIKYFQEVWGVTFRAVKDKGFYRLQCGTQEARKFIEIVRPYIHPTMLYKIDIKVGSSQHGTPLIEVEDIVH